MKCPACGQENPKDASYCSKCGSKLPHSAKSKSVHSKKRRVGNKAAQKAKSLRNLTVLVAAAAFTLFLVVRFTSTSNHSAQSNRPADLNQSVSSNPIENKSSDPIVEQKVSQVVSNFLCSCSGCNEPLDKCDCETAITERNFIRSALESGQSVTQVILAVNKTYGNRKPLGNDG